MFPEVQTGKEGEREKNGGQGLISENKGAGRRRLQELQYGLTKLQLTLQSLYVKLWRVSEKHQKILS